MESVWTPEYRRDYAKTWVSNNPKKCKAYQKKQKTKLTQMWTTYQNTAKRRGYHFDIPVELFNDLVTDSCYYCGSAPDPRNGIDRVDNSQGYVMNNVVTACKTCNYAKHDQSQLNFEMWLDRLVRYRKKEG